MLVIYLPNTFIIPKMKNYMGIILGEIQYLKNF